MIFAPVYIASALILNGCICPPCEAQGPGGAQAGGEGAGNAGTGVSPKEDRYVFWDGEGAGESAKGWSDCDKKEDGCKGTLVPEPKVGKEESTGLHFHGEGPGWIGLGWNFIGWWPEDGGVDVSGYSKLTFSIKVDAESEEVAPDLGALNVSLRCSKGKKDSAAVSIKAYAPELLDGEWHDVAIPLGEFTKEEFDPGTVWEMNLSTWSASPKKFDIYVDNIAVER
jgi:hypothetical protein